MSVKFKLGLLFLHCSLFTFGICAQDLKDQIPTIWPSDSLFNLQISKFDELPTEKPAVVLPIKEEGDMIIREERKSHASPKRLLFHLSDQEYLDRMPELDSTTPTGTVPMIDPTTPTTATPTYDPTPTYPNPTPTTSPVTNPYTTPTTTPTNPATNPYTAPTTTTPTPTTGGTPTSSSGQTWCVASPTASQTALQVALDYACGFGGSDCSAIQQGGSCFNPDTLRDHASYAFNSYYQKNPVQTSCDFGGAAVVTHTDPSTTTCQFPSSSTSSSTTTPMSPDSQITPPTPFTSTTPTNPGGFGNPPSSPSTGSFGFPPPDDSGNISNSISKAPSIILMILLLSLVHYKIYE